MSKEESDSRVFPTISIAATNNASSGKSPTSPLALDNGERDLLSDPSLVDNFADILKIRPMDYRRDSNCAENDNESESASGSVVVTPKVETSSPSKQRSSVLSNTSSHYSVRNDREIALAKETQGKELKESSSDSENVNYEKCSRATFEQGKGVKQDSRIQVEGHEGIEEQSDAHDHENQKDQIKGLDYAVTRREKDKLADSIEPDASMGNETFDNTDSLELSHEYDYSDSDFEDNMEKRLHDLSASSSSLEKTESKRSADDDDNDSNAFEGFDLESSDDDDGVENENADFEIEVEQGNGVTGNDIDSDDEGDQELTAEGYGPQYPPKELDPEKLYALHSFFGPDPSHCQLVQDEPCMLLNDQDSYWWLVKRYSDNKIGFAPAELLETFPERLARLNCWKNENMSSQSFGSKDTHKTALNNDENEEANETINTKITDESIAADDRSNALKDYNKGNKSVSFNDVVGYADRYIESELQGDDEADPSHRDEFTQVDLALNNQKEDDETSEVVSDVSFNTASMPLLDIKKVRRSENKDLQLNLNNGRDIEPQIESEVDIVIEKDETSVESTEVDAIRGGNKALNGEDDALRKIFEAPVVPFAKNSTRSGTAMANSNSDYSISTIGEFSPSSSEWTNDSPQLISDKFQGDPDVIPSSRAIQDFSKFVESPVDKNDSSENKNRTVDHSSDKLSDIGGKDRCISTNDAKDNNISVASSSSSSDVFLMDSERVASSTSVNSTSSASKQNSNLKHGTETDDSSYHPFVHQLYNPVLLKMDDLLRQLDEIVNK